MNPDSNPSTKVDVSRSTPIGNSRKSVTQNSGTISDQSPDINPPAMAGSVSNRDSLVALEALLNFQKVGAGCSSSSSSVRTRAPSDTSLYNGSLNLVVPHAPHPTGTHLAPIPSKQDSLLLDVSSSVAVSPRINFNNSGNNSVKILNDNTAKYVRKEAVEAALRSKPQRGRKRENLSNEERLELTRTRNREHAKITRVRKKARHDELLQVEKLYKESQEQNVLNERRQVSITQFFAARSGLLSVFCNNISAKRGNSIVSYSDISSEDNCADSNRDRIKFTEKLKEVLADPVEFIYRVNSNCPSQRDRNVGDLLVPGLAGASEMLEHDLHLLSRLHRHKSAVFKIENTANDIAISSNTGFARFILLISNTNGESVSAAQGVVYCHFAEKLEKILSAECWFSSPDRNDGESLVRPFRFPSLISFDNQAGVDSSHPFPEEKDDFGPGMNI